ncbi:MAG TPA: hypothetical protein ENJ08_16700 [Gammaproteobacteria bacterium]|nr:hypothetical protein [Gammaproteobacteria bacterium]
MKKILILAASILGLTGCVSNDMSDLEAFVKNTKATYKGKVKPLPEFKHQPPYVYAASDIRDPFKPVVDIEVASGPYRGPRPDESRPREPLEEFSLDSLKMVGTLAQKDGEWALIKDPDGLLHRVAVGHYMGKNYGRVVSVDEEKVALVELVPDFNGGWTERNAAIALSE